MKSKEELATEWLRANDWDYQKYWAIWVANKESKMIPAILHHLEEAIKEAKALPKTRESSLVITKLEEALHWYRAIPSAQ